ncbi:MAG: hypothetical protein K2L27_06190 [Muribaculaceae bacterium]|nr:hypothetical protein [Muribaculaceae bacterium]
MRNNGLHDFDYYRDRLRRAIEHHDARPKSILSSDIDIAPEWCELYGRLPQSDYEIALAFADYLSEHRHLDRREAIALAAKTTEIIQTCLAVDHKKSSICCFIQNFALANVDPRIIAEFLFAAIQLGLQLRQVQKQIDNPAETTDVLADFLASLTTILSLL